MKISLIGRDYNRIMTKCAPAVSRDDVRETLRYIALECNGGKSVATALDGFMMMQVAFSYEGDDGTVFLLPSGKVEDDCFVDIEVEDDKISITVDDVAITRRYNQPPLIDWRKIVTKKPGHETKAVFAMNSKLLKQMLKGFKNNDVIMFEVGEPLGAVVFRGYEQCGLLLPMRVDPSVEFMDFGGAGND